jgi:hypothetical protein
MKRSLTIGSVLVACTAALGLGLAAPASAAPQAPEALRSGTAWSGNNGTGTGTSVTANLNCQTVGTTTLSASTDSDAVLSIVWYQSASDCNNISGGVSVAPGTTVDFGTTSRPVYRLF